MSLEKASVFSSSFLTRLSMDTMRCTSGSLMCRPSESALPSSTLPKVSRMPVEPTGTVAKLSPSRITTSSAAMASATIFAIFFMFPTPSFGIGCFVLCARRACLCIARCACIVAEGGRVGKGFRPKTALCAPNDTPGFTILQEKGLKRRLSDSVPQDICAITSRCSSPWSRSPSCPSCPSRCPSPRRSNIPTL